MLSYLIALAAAGPSMTDLTAAVVKVRANHVLSESLTRHAHPVLTCAAKALKAENNKPASGGEAAVVKRMGEIGRRCHTDAETVVWAASIKKAYPEFSDRMAKMVGGYALSLLMFETLPLKPS